ncbi:hypothetical protein EVAR_52078_1 [Eumeta japonica]|uniref:Uncharacterized protein n=1 Tax=Eumeta variegata TaxID=151549 RepID=A0A4C1XZY3_EUMVA|nr:hypothetical protein EVAR_52078_1 [Eumeta japonica]
MVCVETRPIAASRQTKLLGSATTAPGRAHVTRTASTGIVDARVGRPTPVQKYGNEALPRTSADMCSVEKGKKGKNFPFKTSFTLNSPISCIQSTNPCTYTYIHVKQYTWRRARGAGGGGPAGGVGVSNSGTPPVKLKNNLPPFSLAARNKSMYKNSTRYL